MFERERKPFVDMGRKNLLEPPADLDVSGMDVEGNEITKNAVELAKQIDEDTKRQMSPPGALGLPEKLEEKRLRYKIIDSAFDTQAAFERVFVWQLPLREETFGNTGIVMPQVSRDREKRETPMGVIVSAGLGAMNILTTNGYELGDTVWFLKQGLWRIKVGFVRNIPVELMILSAGDIVGSMELADKLKRGGVRYRWDKEGSQWYLERDGQQYQPQSPWVGADYE